MCYYNSPALWLGRQTVPCKLNNVEKRTGEGLESLLEHDRDVV